MDCVDDMKSERVQEVGYMQNLRWIESGKRRHGNFDRVGAWRWLVGGCATDDLHGPQSLSSGRRISVMMRSRTLWGPIKHLVGRQVLGRTGRGRKIPAFTRKDWGSSRLMRWKSSQSFIRIDSRQRAIHRVPPPCLP